MIKSTAIVLSPILILFMIMIPGTISAQSFDQPVEYMQYINESFDALRKDTWAYVKVASSGKNARKVEKRRINLINELNTQGKRVNSMPGYNGNTEYRDQVVEYLNLAHIVINEDYGKILNMEEIAEESYDAMEAYLLAKERANDKMNEAENLLNESQKIFAAANNIRLLEAEEDKLSRKINQASKVIRYYNQIYLIFFKVYKEEAYFLAATSEANVGAMEQHRKSILSLVKEAKSSLDTIPSYQRDGSIKTGCFKMLNFYQSEATVHFPKLTDFYLKKEEFETVNKAFNSMKKVQKTQQVVDNFNKAVNAYNASINAFNKTNDLTFKTRSKNLNGWNKTIKGFMDRNMP